MTEQEQLEALQAALSAHGTSAHVDPGAIPVLWIPIPQTWAVREMVHVSGRYYMWDGTYWPLSDPHALAARLAAYVAAYPPSPHQGTP